jgi:hypothetical protein
MVVEGPPATFVATCSAEIDHFSVYALVAPLDSDGVGVGDACTIFIDGFESANVNLFRNRPASGAAQCHT